MPQPGEAVDKVASLFFLLDGGEIGPAIDSSSYDISAVSIVVSTFLSAFRFGVREPGCGGSAGGGE